LDVGVGTGRFAVPLGVREGIEPSGAMARLAVERGVNENLRDENVFYRDATFFSTDEVVFHLSEAGFGEFEFRQTIFGHPGHPLHYVKEIDNGSSGCGPEFGGARGVVVRNTPLGTAFLMVPGGMELAA